MYQEYAIDPNTICRSFDRFRYVWDALGYDEGRLLSVFPKKWFRELYESDSYKGLSEIQRSSVLERIKTEKFQKRRVVAAAREVSETAESWVGLAVLGHQVAPFHAIIAETNIDSKIAVTPFDELNPDSPPWGVPKPWIIKRKGRDLGAVAKRLLTKGRVLLFVDPHFCFEPRYTKAFEHYFAALSESAAEQDRIEIHLSYSDKRGTWEYFENEFIKKAGQLLTKYCPSCSACLGRIEFFVWEHTEDFSMHPRYIICDFAGLGFETGLDEDTHGNSDTDVHRIGGASLEKRRGDFMEQTAPRRLILKFKVV